MLGCSLIISQTQIGPIIVSKRKKRFTSAAGINLGAIVTNTKGIATQRIHIKGTIIRSLFSSTKLSIKNKENDLYFKILKLTAEKMCLQINNPKIRIVRISNIYQDSIWIIRGNSHSINSRSK